MYLCDSVNAFTFVDNNYRGFMENLTLVDM
jgi:hypothetical protein